MRNNRMITGAVCAAILGAMITFHAYGDLFADVEAGSSLSAIVAEAAESDSAAAESDLTDTESDSAAAESDSTDTESDSAAAGTASGALDTTDLFSDRDLEQTADLTGATYVTVADGETVNIKAAGVYVLSGTAANAQILVNVGDEDKVQLVLDGVTMTNESTPCIYVKNADKVFVTTTDTENTLTVSGTFTADGTTNTDAVIFSKDDLVLNGTGTLTITSSENGITSKDDLKITGGTIQITCTADAIEANDSIRIADGTIGITTDKDGLHAENEEDNTLGYVYIGGGSLTISAGDDAVHATTFFQMDGGTLDLTAAEGIEGTYIQINNGTVRIAATDDGINAGQKSTVSTPTIEINGGEISVDMGSGDTDAIDANGNLILNGGTLNLTAQSPFDYDGTAENNGTTIIVNGEQTDEITNQMMGGGFMGGQMGGHGNFSGQGEMTSPEGENGTEGGQGNFKRGGAAGKWGGQGDFSRNQMQNY